MYMIEVGEDICKSVSSGHDRGSNPELTAAVDPAWMGSIQGLPLDEELLAVNACWGRKNQF